MNRQKPTNDKVRITLDMTPQFYQRFEQLENLVEADSKSSLLRQALQLYEYVAKRTVDGWSFQAVPPGDNPIPEKIVFLGAATLQAPI